MNIKTIVTGLLLLLAVGGSATVDGGTGAARALGWRFLDARDRDVPEGGRGLAAIRRIVLAGTAQIASAHSGVFG